MRAVVLIVVLLIVVPTLLNGVGAAPLIVIYLAGLNLFAGYRFWTARQWGSLGPASVALTYLASGVFLFTLLAEPILSEESPAMTFKSLAATLHAPVGLVAANPGGRSLSADGATALR
jgi:hypothetical protein